MENNTQKLEKILSELANDLGDKGFIVANPETIKELKAQGFPFQSKFITYKEYLDNLFADKRKLADELMGNFPPISDKIAHSSVKALYEQIRECYALGIFGAAITLAGILLELSLKHRLHKEQTIRNPNYQWEEIEKLNLKSTISGLYKINILSQKEKAELDNFNLEVRNPYMHYNIKRLVRDIMIKELPVAKIETGEKEILRDVRLIERPYLWFGGKKFLDEARVNDVLNFCVGWTNKILV